MAKYKIIPSSRTIVHSPISIGNKAEKGVEAIEFDLTAWVETYGSGTLTVIMRRWGDAIPYPIALEIDENNKATWTLSDIDTAKAGMAYAQLNYIVGDEVVKKSDIYTFRVMDSLTGEGEPPEAYESWLEHLTHLAAEAMAEVLDIEGIVTDKTLTVDGGIADAKAAGDALALKADKSTTYTKTEVDALIDDVEVETDTTLSVSGAPADAAETGRQIGLLKADFAIVSELKKVVDSNTTDIEATKQGLSEIESMIGFDVNYDSEVWQRGAINSTTGITTPSNIRARTKTYISKNYKWIKPKDGYMYALFAYDSNEFVGVYNGTNFVKGTLTFLTERTDLDDLSVYDILVVVAKNDSSVISGSEGVNAVGLYCITDTTLTKASIPADSKAVGQFKKSTRFNPVIQYMCRDGRATADVPPDSFYAIRATAENEYDIIRFSVSKTTDGQYVAVHDVTINNLARNMDGSAISESVKTAECTLAQLNEYDWGIAYGEQYAGLQVPMLEDCLKYASLYNLKVALDFKWASSFNDTDADNIIAMLAKYGHYEALIMVALDGNKNRFYARNKRLSYSYTGTMESFATKQDYISSLLTGRNKVYLFLQPASDTPTQEMINFAAANGFDIMATEIGSMSELIAFGFDKGLTLIECNNIPNIKEAVNAYAETLT